MRAVLPGRPERAVPRLLTQAVVIPAALSALVALVLVGEVRALVSLSRWVQHTDQVIDSAHQLAPEEHVRGSRQIVAQRQVLIDDLDALLARFDRPMEVHRGPYEYSVPGHSPDFTPQNKVEKR